jgi:hypothetical protein
VETGRFQAMGQLRSFNVYSPHFAAAASTLASTPRATASSRALFASSLSFRITSTSSLQRYKLSLKGQFETRFSLDRIGSRVETRRLQAVVNWIQLVQPHRTQPVVFFPHRNLAPH